MFVVKVAGGDFEGVKSAESCSVEDYNGSLIDNCDKPVAQ